MKKLKVLLALALVCFIASFSKVNAALNENSRDITKLMLDENSIVINTDYSHENLGAVKQRTQATDGGSFTVNADEHRVYTMHNVTGPNASVTMTYNNVGYVNSGPNKGRNVSADMTLSDLKMSNGSSAYNSGKIGFNKYYMGFILFESDNPEAGTHRGSVCKVTVRFFYTDAPGTYINIGTMYMGIGGFNSEKLVMQGDTNVLGVPQWEWASFQNTAGTTNGYHDTSCLIKKYSASQTSLTASDDGGDTVDYGWGVGGPYSYTNMATGNKTGREIISNGGNRLSAILEVMADQKPWQNSAKYQEYRNRIKNGFWMFDVPVVNGISQFQFEFGKSFGTVELGLKPVLLADHIPAQPEKSVDKAVAHENETLTYTVNQRTGFLQSNATNETQFNNADTVYKYSSMSIVDELPNEVDYVANSIVVRQGGTTLAQGTDYTVSGPTANANGRKELTVSFTSNYLQNKMRYVGETYTITFNAKVKDLTYDTAVQIAKDQTKIFTAVNGCKTIINGVTVKGNEVETKIIYDILEKGDEHTIFNTKVSDVATPTNGIIPEIPGGRDNNTVDFEPQIGYYIDKVEWQTQADRYAPTTEGLSNVTDIPSTGKVTIPEEKNGSETSYKFSETMDNSEGDTLNYDPFGKTTYTFDDVDNNHYVKITTKPMMMVINVSKVDAETGKETQGDASFENGQYTVYGDEALTEVVDVITIDEEGNGSSKELPLDKGTTDAPYGEYWIKETVAPEGYNLDETVYNVKQTARDQNEAREKVSYHDITSTDDVIKGKISVVKSLNSNETSENDPAAGCILYLTLESKGAPVYEATIDQYGTAVFEEIPYGTYTITESEEARAAGYKLIKPETGIYVQNQDQSIVRIFEEPPIEAYIQVTKKDAETGITIPMANTKYKIWSYKENKYVELHSYPSGVISEFLTNEEGMFTTPEPLKIGRYRLDELTPPTGYHNEDMDFVIEDGVYNWDDEALIIPLTQNDTAQKGRIQITKKAEVLVGSRQETDPDTGLEVYIPQYETRGLAGVRYKITAKENITTADGTVRMAQGQSVYVTTGEDGIATTDYLYLGEYEVTEDNAPDGYALNSNVETVVLDYRTNGTDNAGKLIVLDDYTTNLNFENERIPYELSFDKTFGETEYNNVTEETKNSVKFGLYAAEDIKVYNSQVAAISKDKLLEIIPVVDGKCTATVDLPVGSYYIKELDLDIPFRIDPNQYPFEFKPNCNTQKVTITIPTINNDIDTGEMYFLKVSRKVYNRNKDIIDDILANNDIDAFNEFAQEYGLAGSKYQVFFKVNGEYTPLQVKNAEGEYEDIFFVTGETGIDEATLPVGTYYVKELEAPVDHEIDPNYHAIVVSSEGINLTIVEDPKIQGKVTVIHKDIETGEIIYDIEEYEDDIGEEYHTVDREQEINDRYTPDFKIYELVEEELPENADGEFKVEEQTVVYYYVRLKGHLTVIKKDAETGDRLKGCKFTIKDLITGQTLVENAVTDENGEWSMEDVPYGRYVFTEVEAPEGYVLEEGSIGAIFDVKTEETVFEIVNTGDIQVVALAIAAIVSTFGIVYISKRKFAKNK